MPTTLIPPTIMVMVDDSRILLSVLHLNNAGASLIPTGGCQEATSYLSEALQSCNTLLKEGGAGEKFAGTWDNQAIDKCMTQTSPDHDDNRSRTRCDGYVYMQTIHMPEETVTKKDVCLSRSLLSLTVIFNLALAHHKQALINKERCHQRSCGGLAQLTLTKLNRTTEYTPRLCGRRYHLH